MLISLFPTPLQFLGSAGQNPKLILKLCLKGDPHHLPLLGKISKKKYNKTLLDWVNPPLRIQNKLTSSADAIRAPVRAISQTFQILVWTIQGA